MKKIIILTLQCLILSCLHSQGITINDIVGRYSYPSIAEREVNIRFIHNGKAYYHLHYQFNWVKDINIGRYELSDSVIMVFKDTLSSDILYEFQIIDSLNIKVLYSANETVIEGAFFHRQSGLFHYLDYENLFQDLCSRVQVPYPWVIVMNSKRKNEDEEYECDYYSKKERPAQYRSYTQDSSKILPKSIYFPNTLIARDVPKEYYGRYQYSSGGLVRKPLIEFDLYQNGYSLVYKSVTSLNNNTGMMEVTYKEEEGYCNMKGPVISLFSKNDSLLFSLKVIDSLNYNVLDSNHPFLKSGDVVYRVAAYFYDNDYICSFLDYGICSRWLILPAIVHGFECLYREYPNGKTIEFYYDQKKILPRDIYKLKEKTD